MIFLPEQRIGVLSVALEAASARLDALLEERVYTTNLLDAMAGRGKYVPAYVFDAARVAGTTDRFECLIFDQRPFFERVVAEMRDVDPALRTDRVEQLLGQLALPPRGSEEWRLQSRALHMRRVLDLAFGLLEETAREGLADVPTDAAGYHFVAVQVDEPPLCYRSRDEILKAFSRFMSLFGLDREAGLLDSIVGWKPSTHGGRLFVRAW